MLTKEIKKGDRIIMGNGWYGTMKDNGRGITRIAEIEGFYTETGSVYSHDIVAVIKDGNIIPITHSKKELDMKQMVETMFG